MKLLKSIQFIVFISLIYFVSCQKYGEESKLDSTENHIIELGCNLELPEAIIDLGLCSKNSSIHFGNYKTPLKGIPPYTYKWSNGVEKFNNINVVAGLYHLTVTDANGCTAVNSWEIEDDIRLTVIEDVHFDELICETNEVVLHIDYYLSDSLVWEGYSDFTFGYEIQIISSDGALSLSNEVKVFSGGSGFGKIQIGSAYQGGKAIIRPFVFRRSKPSTLCFGNSTVAQIPKFDLGEKYDDTKLFIKKEHLSDCNLEDKYFLAGFCGSPRGCKVTSSLQKNQSQVPFGDFQISLVDWRSSLKAEIQPILPDGLNCRPSESISSEIVISDNKSNPITYYGKNNWTKGKGCNCYDFVFDIKKVQDWNPKLEISNHTGNPTGTKVTQTGDQTATLCIEQNGKYCVAVKYPKGCVMNFCDDFNIRKLNISALNIIRDNEYNPFNDEPSPNGKAAIWLAPTTKGLIDWQIEPLAGDIDEISDTEIRITGLLHGKYRISAKDVNECSQDFFFEVYPCDINRIFRSFYITERPNYLNLEQVIFGVSFLKKSRRPYTFNTIRAILDALDISWMYPDGSVASGLEIRPTISGMYTLIVTTPCGIWEAHKFFYKP